MPTPPPRRPGAPIWLELDSPDPERAAHFYRELLGVRITEPNEDYGGLRSIDHEHGTIAALMPAAPGASIGWIVYLHAPDLDAVVARVQAAGGAVTLPPGDVGPAGRLAMIRDPSGAEVGLWEPGAQYGTQVQDEPGAPIWYELGAATRYRDTIGFYEQALGWETSVLADDADLRMVVYGEVDDAVAGIFEDAGARRSLWHVYFMAEDVDASARYVESHGGAVLEPPEDTPYGRMCRATDPDGSVFDLMRPPG